MIFLNIKNHLYDVMYIIDSICLKFLNVVLKKKKKDLAPLIVE